MIHSRRLLRATLLGVASAAALLPTQSAQAAELVTVSASVRCSQYHPVSFKITAKVPATTAPGEAVSLTDVQVAVDFDYPFTQLPTGDNVITGRVEIDSVSIATVGATPASVALAGLPRTFAPAAANDSSQTRFLTETISVGDSGAAATAGTGPVVLRLARVDYKIALDRRSGPQPLSVQTCEPVSDVADLAVVPSTGPLPGAPRIDSISPAEASVAGGETVTIKGKDLAAVTAIGFDGFRQPVAPTVIDDETIQFVAPVVTHSAFPGDTVELSVRSSFGTSGTTLFSWGGPRKALPTITSVSPNQLETTSPAVQEFELTGTGFDRLSEGSLRLQFADGTNAMTSIESVSSDGTSARVLVNRGNLVGSPATWPAGTGGFAFSAVGACATASCSTVDTPGDDVTFAGSTPTPTPSPSPSPSPTPTPTPSPSPSPSPTTVPAVSFAIAGSAALKTLTKGSVPLGGALTGVTLAPGTGAFGGTLALNQATANLTALGFLPVKAQVAFVATEPVSGTLAAGSLKVAAKLRIKLPKVSVLGVELAGGANCQAKQITSVALTSTGPFTAAGGALAGTFTISDLSGCGFLTGIVSPLTAGSGNAIALQLTPKN